jgi:hypothetical protein
MTQVGPSLQPAHWASDQQAVTHWPFTHSSALAQSEFRVHSETTVWSGLQMPCSQMSAE